VTKLIVCRNILSNQDLILGFLRSAQHVLESGDIPSFTSSKADKSANDDEDQPMPSQEIIDEFQLRTLRGTVLITLRNVSPYTLWYVFTIHASFSPIKLIHINRGVTRLAKSPPPPANKAAPPYPRYRLLRSFVFHRKLWEGYSHRLTKGERGVTGVGGEDRTWEFCLADVPEPSSREDVRA
jgi:25S rRNA (uracil2634-N3)-methyltransferase